MDFSNNDQLYIFHKKTSIWIQETNVTNHTVEALT